MDNDIKPGSQPNPNPVPQQPAVDPTSNSPNTPVYGQTATNVQPLPPQQNQATPEPKTKRRFRDRLPKIPQGMKGLFSTFQLVIGAVILAFLINAFVFQSYEVVGDSMYPTLNNGDRLIISKVGKTWSNTFGSTYLPARGEVIVFRSPSGQNRQLIKRVIAYPGEKVILKDGDITVINDENPDGFDPDLDYKDILPPDTSNEISVEVPDGEIFVAGDNRVGGASLDSRTGLGTVPLENVVGSLVLRILPFDSAKFY